MVETKKTRTEQNISYPVEPIKNLREPGWTVGGGQMDG